MNAQLRRLNITREFEIKRKWGFWGGAIFSF
jgi:hypothetical protein